MKNSKESVYYIGTLVTFKRDENVFEVIDGQQRLTTIFIILCALNMEVKNKLTYSARKPSTLTIKAMYENKCRNIQDKKRIDFGEEYDAGILDGYKCTRETLDKIVGESLGEFKDFLLNKVHIIHIIIPTNIRARIPKNKTA